MAKTLQELLKEGGVDREALKKLQAQAAGAGLTKRVIHIELDLVTGQLKSQATPMDHVMHLGMLEFYRATVIAQMVGGRVAAPPPETKPQDETAPAPQGAECGHQFGKHPTAPRPNLCNLAKGHDGHHQEMVWDPASDCCNRNSHGENHADGCKNAPPPLKAHRQDCTAHPQHEGDCAVPPKEGETPAQG